MHSDYEHLRRIYERSTRARRKEESPPGRLEGWLVRKIHGGVLKTLPRYRPVRDRDDHDPESYARKLLAALGLRTITPGTWNGSRTTGCAFRSWAERGSSPLVWPRGAERDRRETPPPGFSRRACYLHLLKFHFLYHEATTVLNFAYKGFQYIGTESHAKGAIPRRDRGGDATHPVIDSVKANEFCPKKLIC